MEQERNIIGKLLLIIANDSIQRERSPASHELFPADEEKGKNYDILKYSRTSNGIQPNSWIAFSLLKVSDLVILSNFMELIGAFFPIQSPIKAKDFANQYGTDRGSDLPSCLQIDVSNARNVGCPLSHTL